MTVGHIYPKQLVEQEGYAWGVKIVPGSWDGHSTFGPGVEGWAVSMVYFPGLVTMPAGDIAILKSYTQLGALAGAIGFSYSASTVEPHYSTWTMTGYGQDVAPLRPKSQQGLYPRGYNPAYYVSGAVSRGTFLGALLRSDADGDGGNSGSPFYNWYPFEGGSPTDPIRPLALGLFTGFIEFASSLNIAYNTIATGELVPQFAYSNL